MVTVVGCALAAALLASAAAKAADPLGTAVGLGTFGFPRRVVRPAVWLLVAVEATAGGALLAGEALPAAGLLALFAAGQGMALAAGRGGAPCGCLGGHGRLSAGSAARAGLLALGAAAVAVVGPGAAPAWTWSLCTLAAAVAARWSHRRPGHALDISGEGPEPGSVLALEVPAAPVRLAVFTSEGCGLCDALEPALSSRRALPGVAVRAFEEARDAEAWRAARVPGSPYAIALDAGGRVLAKGTVNTGAQLDALLAAARPAAAGPEAFDGSRSRRDVLSAAASVVAVVAGARIAGALVRPGEAEAYHFCGHIYTTDSCPHPTGLPRIDSRGFPLRARDGHRVDDLGRLVDLAGLPVDEDGEPLLDADGRRLPPAPRSRVCAATGRRFNIPVQTDGAWYRCCGGRVRKLVDCCSTHPRRINGDRALRGYCHKRRKVFCVMYYQSGVPC